MQKKIDSKQVYRWLKDNNYFSFIKLFKNFDHFDFFIKHIDYERLHTQYFTKHNQYFGTPLELFTNCSSQYWINHAFVWTATPYNNDYTIWFCMHRKYMYLVYKGI